MERARKEELVAELRQTFQNAGVIVVTHYRGLTVEESTNLRRQMREAGAQFKVTKNTLARLALKDTEYEALADSFTGPTAIAVSEDPVAAAKAAAKFAKENEKLVLLAGAMSGGRSSTPMASRRLPLCRRSTSCVESSSVFCRRRLARSRRFCRRLVDRLPAFSARAPSRERRPDRGGVSHRVQARLRVPTFFFVPLTELKPIPRS